MLCTSVVLCIRLIGAAVPAVAAAGCGGDDDNKDPRFWRLFSFRVKPPTKYCIYDDHHHHHHHRRRVAVLYYIYPG